jgi:hypothetical protein
VEAEEEHGGPFVVDVPDVFTQAFVIEKDSKRFPQSGGWGYAMFNYEAASDNFTADPSLSDCGHACHVAVKAKDHIFHRTRSVDGARPCTATLSCLRGIVG